MLFCVFQVADIQTHDFGRDPQKDARDLDSLRNIKAELIGQERKLKDLMAAGERLADGLAEAGMVAEAEDVRAVLEERGEQYQVNIKTYRHRHNYCHNLYCDPWLPF